jgi:hypothetical protein
MLSYEEVKSLRLVDKNLAKVITQRDLLILNIENIHREAFKLSENFRYYSASSLEEYIPELVLIPNWKVKLQNVDLKNKLRKIRTLIIERGAFISFFCKGSKLETPVREWSSGDVQKLKEFCNEKHIKANLPQEKALHVQLKLHDLDNCEIAFEKLTTKSLKEIDQSAENLQPLPSFYPIQLFKNIKENGCIALPMQGKILKITCRQQTITEWEDDLVPFEEMLDFSKHQAHFILEKDWQQVYIPFKENSSNRSLVRTLLQRSSDLTNKELYKRSNAGAAQS